MDDQKSTETGKEVLLIFAYADKERAHYFQLNDTDANNGTSVYELKLLERQFSQKLFKSSYTGSIHNATWEGSRIKYNEKSKPTGFWKSESDRAKWKALQSAADEEGKIIKNLKENMLQETLQPVRSAYMEANYSQQRLILAEAIRIITGGRK